MESSLKLPHYYAGVGALITWLAIIIQYILMMQHRTNTIALTTVHFLGYFTILSNILVAIVFTLIFLKGGTEPGRGFSPSFLTATCLYIGMVAVIYNLVLRKLAAPEGWDLLANELLHVVVPALFILFWVFFVPRASLPLKDSFVWLIFPFLYLIYTFISGYYLQRYPYPFVNVTELGMTKTLFNCLGVALVFWVLGCLLIWVKAKTGR